jgi:hypothetical protein
MNRRHPVGVLVVALKAAALLAFGAFGALGTGCEDNPVGRLCDLGTATPQTAETVVASPSLDCVTRTCLRVVRTRELPPGSKPLEGNTGLCTAECSTDDECDRVPESPCILGFTCAVAITAGPFCCRKFCICKDYIVVPDSGPITAPKACDPDIKENTCCNLDGRVSNPDNNPDYEHCKR